MPHKVKCKDRKHALHFGMQSVTCIWTLGSKNCCCWTVEQSIPKTEFRLFTRTITVTAQQNTTLCDVPLTQATCAAPVTFVMSKMHALCVYMYLFQIFFWCLFVSHQIFLTLWQINTSATSILFMDLTLGALCFLHDSSLDFVVNIMSPLLARSSVFIPRLSKEITHLSAWEMGCTKSSVRCGLIWIIRQMEKQEYQERFVVNDL